MSELQDRLGECHRRSGLTPESVASRARLAFGLVEGMLSGAYDPSPAELEAVASVYKTTTTWLSHGRREVNAWAAFRESHDYGAATLFSAGPHRRSAAVMQFVMRQYAGHLSAPDLVEYWHGSGVEWVEKISAGTSLTYPLAVMLAQLTGVPVSWIFLGQYGLQGSGLAAKDADGLTAAYTHIMEMWVRKKNRGVSKADFSAAREVLSLLEDEAWSRRMWDSMLEKAMRGDEQRHYH